MFVAARRSLPYRAFRCIGAICCFVVGCEHPTEPSAPTPVLIDPSWVTGAAAAAVNPSTGLFTLDAGPSSVLSSAAADSASLAGARLMLHPETLGGSREAYERDRGAPIAAWDALRVCGRSFRVETPFAEAPMGTSRTLARHMRARWAVTLCGPRGDAQLAVSTSDTRSGARFTGVDYSSADIDSLSAMHNYLGIPPTRAGGVLPSPEAAVREVFLRTGIPVAEVPRPFLIWSPGMTIARYPIWRIALASPFSGEHEDGSPSGSLLHLYVRAVSYDSLDLFTPASEQPAHVWMRFFVSTTPVVLDSVAFAVQGPIVFRRVVVP